MGGCDVVLSVLYLMTSSHTISCNWLNGICEPSLVLVKSNFDSARDCLVHVHAPIFAKCSYHIAIAQAFRAIEHGG